MTVLDSFYLLFKTQGTKEARKDVADLDRQIGELAAKGQKRSEAETKHLNQLRKQRREQTQDLKDAAKQTDEVGQSYVRMAHAIGGVATAYLGLSAIKNGLADAQKTTSALAVQSQWLQQNAADLAAWGGAAKAAGGTAEGLQASIKRLHDAYVEKGIPFPADPFEALAKLAKAWQDQGLSFAQKQQAGLKLGLDEGTIMLLSKGPAAVEKLIEQQRKLLNLTKEDAEAARQLGIAWDNAGTAAQGAANKINTFITPALVELLGVSERLFKYVQKVPKAAEDSAQGAAWKLLKSWWTGKNQFAPASSSARPSSSTPTDPDSPLGIRTNNPTNLRPGGRQATYATPEAGIAAAANNLRRYGRRGWDTVAEVIKHWAPPHENPTAAYVDYVSKQTGFSPHERLNLEDPAVLQKLIGAITRFENKGRNPYGDRRILDAITAGKATLGMVGSTPFNSFAPAAGAGGRPVNVQIGDVNVHTQATDAKGVSGAIADNLRSSMRAVIDNWDDGVLA